jgi:catechol-2,3-dioxygenase
VAVYLQHPEGNGSELFYDRPKKEWERTASGMLRIDQEERDVAEPLPELLGAS